MRMNLGCMELFRKMKKNCIFCECKTKQLLCYAVRKISFRKIYNLMYDLKNNHDTAEKRPFLYTLYCVPSLIRINERIMTSVLEPPCRKVGCVMGTQPTLLLKLRDRTEGDILQVKYMSIFTGSSYRQGHSDVCMGVGGLVTEKGWREETEDKLLGQNKLIGQSWTYTWERILWTGSDLYLLLNYLCHDHTMLPNLINKTSTNPVLFKQSGVPGAQQDKYIFWQSKSERFWQCPGQ